MKNSSLIRVSIGLSVFIAIGLLYHYQHEILDAISLRFRADVGADLPGFASEPRYECTNKGGYVVGWDFKEGQTCASRNLLSLLHWATTIDSTVVEPCTNNSFFNMLCCFNATSTPFHFRDYFDVDYWNKQVLSHHFGRPMISWKDFITSVPCKAIVVYLWKDYTGEEQPTSFVRGDNIIAEDGVEDCINHSDKTTRPEFIKHMDVLTKFSIKIVREVCIKFNSRKFLDLKWFNEQILGSYKPSNVLILFATWSGSFQGNLYFSDQTLHHKTAFEFLKASHRVIADSRKYKEQFLGSSYTAVQLRMVKLAIILKGKGLPSQKIAHYLTVDCPNELASTLRNISGERMLALDLGRFGDGNPIGSDMTDDTMNKVVHKLVNVVYGNKWNWTNWEDSFVQATGGIVDNGYIALVQKMVAVDATCIVTAGPTSQFQNSMLKEYKARVKHPCIHRICTRYM